MARKCVRWGRSNGRKVCRKFSGSSSKSKGRKSGSSKACIRKSGPNKGTPKKGWRIGKGGRCIPAKGR